MREILFRGKTKIQNEQKTSEWVFGGIVHQTDFYGNAVDRWFVIDGTSTLDYDMGENIEVEKETVCECTGLEDKNGRKIFEGDIVKAIYKPKDEDLTTDNFVIKWDKYYCKYVGYYTNKENVYNPLLFGSQTSFEVIGNIFDNPELIGDQP